MAEASHLLILAHAAGDVMRSMAEIARPYVETAKPGDVLSDAPCENPVGWWSVLRNGRPIHHFGDREDALALRRAIAEGMATGSEPEAAMPRP